MDTDDLIRAVAEAGDELARFLETAPPDCFHRWPGEGLWTIAQIGGHASEFPAHWATVAAGLAAHPGAEIGRGADDLGRMAGVDRFAVAAPGDVASAVRRSTGEAVAILSELRPEEWAATGRARDGTERSARFVVEEYILNHCRDHLVQARRVMASFA